MTTTTSIIDADFPGPVAAGRFAVPIEAIPTIREWLARAYWHDRNRAVERMNTRLADHEPDRHLPVPRVSVREGNRNKRIALPHGWQYRAPLHSGRGSADAPPPPPGYLQAQAEEAIDHALGELFAPSPSTERAYNSPRRKLPLTHPDGRTTWEETGDRSPLRPEEWRAAVRIVRHKARRAKWRVARLSGEESYDAFRKDSRPGGYVGSAASRGDDPARVAAALDRETIVVPPAQPNHHARIQPLDPELARAVLCPPDVDLSPGETVQTRGGEGMIGRLPSATLRANEGDGSSRGHHWAPSAARDQIEAPRRRYRTAPAVPRLANITARWTATAASAHGCPTVDREPGNGPVFSYDPAPYLTAWKRFEAATAEWNAANGWPD